MGFGILLFGYTMLIDYGVSVNSSFNIGFDIFPDILGYVLMFIATRKLSPYSSGFKNAKVVSCIMMVFGSLSFVLPIVAIFGKGLALISNLMRYCIIARDLFVFLFNILVFYGIRELAKEVELSKVAKYAVTATVLSSLYFIPRVSLFIISFTQGQMGFIALFYSIFWYVSLLFNVFLCFNCHVRICYEGEEDPEAKESIFEKIIKKLRNK